MSSSSSSTSRPKPQTSTKFSVRNQPQKIYVPKPNPSSSSSNPPKSVPSLTTYLRNSSSSSSSKSVSNKEENNSCKFVKYLPHDEAVALGLPCQAGGLDAVESQRVVDILNDELSKLLKMKSRDFWKEVARNDSLHEFLDSYLQSRHRWYDFPHRGTSGMVAGVIVGELDLCRRVFMVLYRISSSRDPGASANDCLSMKDHTALLQEKKLLDLPKLLDICAIYGHENGELTRSLVVNAMRAQPRLLDNLSHVVSHFLNIVHTMHQRCSSSLEVLISSGTHEDHGHEQLSKGFLEVLDFINDAVVTLEAFADAFKPAALYFSASFDLSYGNEELLTTMARLHDSLLPSLHQGFMLVSNSRANVANNKSGSEHPNIILILKMLSRRIISLGWKILDFCYLHDELIEDSLLQATTKMLPAKVEDPAIRGDIITQTFKDVNAEAAYHHPNINGGTFLQSVEKNFNILSRIGSLRNNGWIFMDEEQFQYLSMIATPPSLKSQEKEPRAPTYSQKEKMHIGEDAIIMESKISQIKDIFPDYGKGFLSACLDVYNQNPEEIIQRILEGTLHNDLLSLDTSLEQIPPPKSASQSRNDKGKGTLVVDSPSQGSASPAKPNHTVGVVSREGTSSSSLSSYGRYTRKSKDDVPDSEVLDSKSAKAAVRSSVLKAEYEFEDVYNDEYDDSLDDLGFSVGESGIEETENLSTENETTSRNSNSKWNSQKKPQFYVKDGKNYSYKVSGSVAVANAREAAVFNQTQKDAIHGLGRGGNIPTGFVKKMDEQLQDEETSDAAEENLGRGSSSSRGRGGRRGGGGGRGGNHYRKDRAMKKHMQGLGGL